MLVFMDTEIYEQMELQQEFVGERSAFLQDGMKVVLENDEGRAIGISLPDQVTLTVVEAESGGERPDGRVVDKPAVPENGVGILVPPFVTAGAEGYRRHERNGLRQTCRLRVRRPPQPVLLPKGRRYARIIRSANYKYSLP